MLKLRVDLHPGQSPLLATAIHNGHYIRPELAAHLFIDQFDRMREEDPCTEYFTDIAKSQLIVDTSRFEVDVNRPRTSAIYLTAEQSWGLRVWKENLPEHAREQSLEEYDAFYARLKSTINRFIDQWGFIVIYDIHSYNFRRGKKEAGPKENPEINLGTASMDKIYWKAVIDHFMKETSAFNYLGRKLTVAENVRFRGGYMAQWVHKNYPGKACVLAIELKKFFMDEWTGAVDLEKIKTLRKVLGKTVPGVLQAAEQAAVKQ